jgi:UDP-3-O-[3-hydroxymyristoyl] glucosamine N-acyltransferase
MQATLAELAKLVGGKVIGDGSTTIRGASPLKEAGPGDITLIDRAERGEALAKSPAAAAVAPASYVANGIPIIQVDDVHRAFTLIVGRFRPVPPPRHIGVSPQAYVSPTAKLGKNVDVHAFATIGDEVEIDDDVTIHPGVHVMAGSKVGAGSTLFPNVVLYENTIVGPRCILHAGVVLGAFGFGYCSSDGCHRLAAQLGNVVLGADVEVGAGSTVDRGTYGSTTIGDGTKIDNHVMVAHNCRIGRHNMLCAQVGIAGSTTTGDYVVMAGQVGVRDHVHIGARAVLGAMAGVINDVPEDARVVGIPATPEREQMIKQAALTKLPEMRRQVKQLQATVDKLTAQLPTPNP